MLMDGVGCRPRGSRRFWQFRIAIPSRGLKLRVKPSHINLCTSALIIIPNIGSTHTRARRRARVALGTGRPPDVRRRHQRRPHGRVLLGHLRAAGRAIRFRLAAPRNGRHGQSRHQGRSRHAHGRAPDLAGAASTRRILPVDERGLVKHEGTRRAYCMNSDVYWDYCKAHRSRHGFRAGRSSRN